MKLIDKLRVSYLTGDIFSLLVAYWLTNWARFYYERLVNEWNDLFPYLFGIRNTIIGCSLLLTWLCIFFFSGYYNRPDKRDRFGDFLATFYSVLIGAGLHFLFVVTNDKLYDGGSRMTYIFFFIFGIYFCVVYISRTFVTSLSYRWRRKKENFSRGLIIGTSKERHRITEAADALHISVVSEIDVYNEVNRGEIDSLYEQIKKEVNRYKIDALYLAFDNSFDTFVGALLYKLFSLDKEIYITAPSFHFYARNLHSPSILKVPLLNIAETRMSEGAKNIKWAFDKLMALMGLVIAAPLFLLIAIAVKRSSEGKVFYSQERIGLHGKPFSIYKFRSMYSQSEINGPTLSCEKDPRITPVGKYLRKYRLDELPQLYNVLRGDMSFVGPRPERSFFISQLIDRAPYYCLLHNVRPGITSLGMVLYGYASNIEEMYTRLQADWIYYNNMSLLLDFKVLIYTISIIFKGKGK